MPAFLVYEIIPTLKKMEGNRAFGVKYVVLAKKLPTYSPYLTKTAI